MKKLNLYKQLKDKQSKEVNDFPIMFAFSTDQFNEGMKKLNLLPTDTNKIYSIGGGGYIRKSDSKELDEMGELHSKEMKESIEADKTGNNFIYDMFYYELNNHEYGYTGDVEQTLESLDLTAKQVQENPILLYSLRKACKDIQGEDEN